MTISNFIHWCGPIAIIAGILNFLSSQADKVPENLLPWVRKGADLSALIALVGIYLYHRETAGIFGLVAFIVALVGVGMLLFGIDYEKSIMVYGFGVILVAVSILLDKSFPSWVPWLWISSAVFGLPGMFIPKLAAILGVLGSLGFGLGFIGVGYILWTTI